MSSIYLEILLIFLKFLPLIFFSIIFLRQIHSMDFFKLLKLFFILYLILIFVNSLSLTLFQYQAFATSPISRHLLPPETPIGYFLGYGFQHFIKEPLLRILGAFTLLIALFAFNKLFHERFFYKEEPLLAAFGFSSLLWPNGFLFVFLVLSIGLIIHFIQLLFFEYNKEKRFSFYYLWIPSWCAVWLFGGWIAKITGMLSLIV